MTSAAPEPTATALTTVKVVRRAAYDAVTAADGRFWALKRVA
jgi:hypothetical protein